MIFAPWRTNEGGEGSPDGEKSDKIFFKICLYAKKWSAGVIATWADLVNQSKP